MSKLKRSYLLTLCHDICKRLFNDTKNKIKVQIAEKIKMFLQIYGKMLASDGWIWVYNHLFLNMMYVSLVGKELLGTIDTFGQTTYIVDMLKRYLIEFGP
jgi:hypothetical protein